MFSYFQNGIINTIPQKSIDFEELIDLITNNPNKTLIGWIRILRIQGNDGEYKKLKRGLPNITPVCELVERSLDGELFKKIFNFLTLRAIDIGLYANDDYTKNPVEYCGMVLSSSIV